MELYPPGYIVMSKWNILVIEHDGQVIEKFLGYWHGQNTYRISSQIDSYDRETDTGRTLSGSHYKFLDKPGALHPKAQIIFDQLKALENVSLRLKYLPVEQ